ncbi:MAG: hypothetical protein J6S67_20085 [Methanobrevibacter sp.]|nr:hypothetical protein [Methanobrevibacter sp.]
MNLTNKGNIILNNEFQFSPKSLTINYESLASENSGRTLDGVMHIYWVFNRIRKLEIELPPSTPALIAQVFSRVQGQEYYITYFDTLEMAEKTIYVYTSNSSNECYNGVVRNGLYRGAKFNAIEIAGELNNTVIRRGVTPSINNTGDLVITTIDVPTTFARSGENLTYDNAPAGVTYSIEGTDLIQYEG